MTDLLRALGPYSLVAPIPPYPFVRTLARREDEPSGALFLLDWFEFPADPPLVAGFLAELSIVTRLRHPNLRSLVEVFPVPEPGVRGAGPTVSLVAVYEHRPSASLRRLLRTIGPMPIPVVISLAQGVLAGLQAAHEHRDREGKERALFFAQLSPEETLLTLDGRVLLDRLVELRPRLSCLDGHPASPFRGQRSPLRFHSPELLCGEPRLPGDNLWSAALILWTCLTGRPPYMIDSEFATLQAIVNHTDSPLATEIPGMSPALRAVFERALARDPAARYPTAAALRAALATAAAPASEAEVAAWAASHGIAALALQEDPPLFSPSLRAHEEGGEALGYRGTPSSLASLRSSESLRSPPSFWQRLRQWLRSTR